MNCILVLICLVCMKLPVSVRSQDFEKCETSSYPPDDRWKVPTFEVDLDLPPELRWRHLMRFKGPMLLTMADDVRSLLKSLIGERIFGIINRSLPKIAQSLPSPYFKEFVGIAEESGLDLSSVTLYNIFYEAFFLCTSIVAQDLEGRLYHARNLDNGAFLGWDTKNHTWRVTEKLHSLTVKLNWMKGGSVIFQSVNFAGYVGVLTAVKKNKFTFSLNKRISLNGGFVGMLEWILLHDHKQHWIAFLTREVMEEAESYSEAQKKLSHTRLLAPTYFILGGTKAGEACIITRDRDNFNVVSLGSPKTDSSWFLVQTNYDYWKTVPFFDDRRGPANKCLRQSSQGNLSLSLLYNVLSTKPVLNKETVYTSLMEVDTGYIEAWKRTCPSPCWPW